MSEKTKNLIRAVVNRHFRWLAGRPILSEQIGCTDAALRNRLDAGPPPGAIEAAGRKAMQSFIVRERGLKR